MRRFGLAYWLSLAVCMFAATLSTRAADTLDGLGAVGPVEKVQGDFEFVEGPTQTPDGSLYFTDIPAESIYRLGSDGKIELFLKPSLHANGLLYGGNNRLLACQMDGQLAAIDLTTKQTQVLADAYEGKRFNACNDLVMDQHGGIYFTDPRFRAPEPLPQGTEAFYYRDPQGKLTRLAADLLAPNGIGLSPDEQTLYVIPSMQSQMMAYRVLAPGKIDQGRVFCTLAQRGDATNGGGDGMAVDQQGNLYITSATGVQVFSPQGKPLGTIAVPEQPANVAFGGPDNKTLYITARTGLYRCSMPVSGLVRQP